MSTLVAVLRKEHLFESEKESRVQQLLFEGANVHARSSNGDLPLTVAAALGYEKICQELIDNGARVNNYDRTLQTPLMHAVRSDNKNIVNRLIRADANVNCQENYGETALMIASVHGYLDMVHILLDANANVDIQNISQQTSLMKASVNKDVRVTERLLRETPSFYGGRKEDSINWIFSISNLEIQQLLIGALHRKPTVSLHGKFRLY